MTPGKEDPGNDIRPRQGVAPYKSSTLRPTPGGVEGIKEGYAFPGSSRLRRTHLSEVPPRRPNPPGTSPMAAQPGAPEGSTDEMAPRRGAYFFAVKLNIRHA